MSAFVGHLNAARPRCGDPQPARAPPSYEMSVQQRGRPAGHPPGWRTVRADPSRQTATTEIATAGDAVLNGPDEAGDAVTSATAPPQMVAPTDRLAWPAERPQSCHRQQIDACGKGSVRATGGKCRATAVGPRLNAPNSTAATAGHRTRHPLPPPPLPLTLDAAALTTYSKTATNTARRRTLLDHTQRPDSQREARSGGRPVAAFDDLEAAPARRQPPIVGRLTSARPNHVCYSLNCPCQENTMGGGSHQATLRKAAPDGVAAQITYQPPASLTATRGAHGSTAQPNNRKANVTSAPRSLDDENLCHSGGVEWPTRKPDSPPLSAYYSAQPLQQPSIQQDLHFRVQQPQDQPQRQQQSRHQLNLPINNQHQQTSTLNNRRQHAPQPLQLSGAGHQADELTSRENSIGKPLSQTVVQNNSDQRQCIPGYRCQPLFQQSNETEPLLQLQYKHEQLHSQHPHQTSSVWALQKQPQQQQQQQEPSDPFHQLRNPQQRRQTAAKRPQQTGVNAELQAAIGAARSGYVELGECSSETSSRLTADPNTTTTTTSSSTEHDIRQHTVGRYPAPCAGDQPSLLRSVHSAAHTHLPPPALPPPPPPSSPRPPPPPYSGCYDSGAQAPAAAAPVGRASTTTTLAGSSTPAVPAGHTTTATTPITAMMTMVGRALTLAEKKEPRAQASSSKVRPTAQPSRPLTTGVAISAAMVLSLLTMVCVALLLRLRWADSGDGSATKQRSVSSQLIGLEERFRPSDDVDHDDDYDFNDDSDVVVDRFALTGVGKSGAFAVVPKPINLIDRSQMIIVNRDDYQRVAEQLTQIRYFLTSFRRLQSAEMIRSLMKRSGCNLNNMFGFVDGNPCVAIVFQPPPASAPLFPLDDSEQSLISYLAAVGISIYGNRSRAAATSPARFWDDDKSLLELECVCSNQEGGTVYHAANAATLPDVPPRKSRSVRSVRYEIPLVAFLRFKGFPPGKELRVSCGLKGPPNLAYIADKTSFKLIVL